MGSLRQKSERLSEYEATRPLSLDHPPIGYFPWDKQSRVRFQSDAPGPSTDNSTTSSGAFFSATHPSAPTERSDSIDSTAWRDNVNEGSPRDTVLLVEDNEGLFFSRDNDRNA